jgi:hypothetical protein
MSTTVGSVAMTGSEVVSAGGSLSTEDAEAYAGMEVLVVPGKSPLSTGCTC